MSHSESDALRVLEDYAYTHGAMSSTATKLVVALKEKITRLESEGSTLRDKIDALENDPVCPYDCDHCHGDSCPCDRFGCAGAKL